MGKTVLNRKSKLYINFFVFFVTILICLLLLEFGLRIIDPNGASHKMRMAKYGPQIYRFDHHQHHTLRSKINIIYKSKEYIAKVKTNSIGLRDYDIHQLNASPSKKILLLGDSVIEAIQVNIKNTVSKQLENYLNSGNPEQYTVINAGVSSYSPILEYIQLKRLVPIFNPYIAILGLYINDFGGDFELSNKKNNKYDDQRTISAVEGDIYFYKPQHFFNRHLYFYYFWQDMKIRSKNLIKKLIIYFGLKNSFKKYYNVDYWNVENNQDKDIYQLTLYKKECTAVTLKYLKIINEYCKNQKMSFVIVIIPQPNQIGKNQVKPGWHCLWYSKPSYIESILYQQIVKNFGSLEKIPVLDLLPAFRNADRQGKKLYFKYDGHWNESGHELTAKEIYRFLVNQRLIPSDKNI